MCIPIDLFAQQPGRTVRIGILAIPSAVNYASRTQALREGLREFGYVEGKNLHLETGFADGKFERLQGLAADLVERRIDVIVTAGTPAIRAARQATRTIPIVIAAVGDAVAGGLVASLAKPGENITGSTYFAPELAAKQLELLKEASAQTTRVAVLLNPNNPAMRPTLGAVESAAKLLKLELAQFPVKEPPEFDSAFASMARNGYRTALVIDDPITISNARSLADLAMRHGLATAGFAEYAEAGGLIGYGADLNAMWRRAAFFVDRILKGTNPGDIPVERSTRFYLVINRKTARALGIGIPPTILLRADRVIE